LQADPALQAGLQRTHNDNGSLFSAAEMTGFADQWTPNDSSVEQRRQDEWDLLGFVIDVPLMSILQPRVRPRRLISSQSQ
jgi:hypothetical protein